MNTEDQEVTAFHTHQGCANIDFLNHFFMKNVVFILNGQNIKCMSKTKQNVGTVLPNWKNALLQREKYDVQ